MTFHFRRICCIVFSAILITCSVFIPASYGTKSNAQGDSRSHAAAGLTLDVARRYYPVSTIKSLIRMVSRKGGRYLQLHVSDNENYGVESRILHQTVSCAACKNGIYTNPASGKKFLSSRQIKELASYASAYHVSLIPEIDSYRTSGNYFSQNSSIDSPAAPSTKAIRTGNGGLLAMTRSFGSGYGISGSGFSSALAGSPIIFSIQIMSYQRPNLLPQ